MLPLIGKEYPEKVILLIDEAKKNIDIIVYDWRWYRGNPGFNVQQFNMALIRASKRGVFVRAIVNDSSLLPILNEYGIKARVVRNKRTLHAKFLLIDGRTLVIGSHNFTKNAFNFNLEVSVIVDVPEEMTRFAELFENLYNI
jgi:phosphatidylserine/phosphatidylglycerophosphate/cardiolipin synthase-like enzyme